MAPAPETGKEAWERGMEGPGLYTGAGIFSVCLCASQHKENMEMYAVRLAEEKVRKKHWKLECLKNKPDTALTKSYAVKYYAGT